MHYHTDVCTGDQRTTLAREHGQVQQEPWRLVFDRLGNAGALRRCSHLRPLALLHPIPSADACFWSRNPTKGFHAYKFSSCTRPRSAPSCSSCVAKAHHLPEILLPLLPSTSHQCDLGAHSPLSTTPRSRAGAERPPPSRNPPHRRKFHLSLAGQRRAVRLGRVFNLCPPCVHVPRALPKPLGPIKTWNS